MYVICKKTSNAVLGHDTSIKYWENGYPFLVNLKVAYPSSDVNVYEVAELPQDVEAEKWCYTEADGFYPNPNWHEPSAYDLAPQEVVDAIIDEYTNELIEMGVL